MDFMKEHYKRALRDFSKQPALADSILRRILQSKLLMSDHIDLLDSCGALPPRISTYKTHSLPIAEGVILSTLTVTSFNKTLTCPQFFVPIAASIFGVYLTVKGIFVVKNRISQYRFNETLLSVGNADSAIRRHISYFRESKFLGSEEKSNAEFSLKTIAEIIRIIHAEVKLLESIKLPDDIECIYEPLEDLETCIYFQNNINTYTDEDLKSFYNIFLYFQSQYWMRLCLLFVYVRSSSFEYLNNENIELRKHLKTCVSHLNTWLDTKMQLIAAQNKPDLVRPTDINLDMDSVDLAKIKRSSQDILSRLIAISNQYHKTDGRLQQLEMNVDSYKVEVISKELNRLKEAIDACQENFHTITLIYNKCLSHKTLDVVNDQETETECAKVDAERIDNKGDLTPVEESREYFGMRDLKDHRDTDSDTDGEESHQLRRTASYEDELNSIDKRLTRSFFAPVLKQLKTKIDPIKEQMKERELNFLLSRGIDRERIINFNEEQQDACKSDNDSDCDSDYSDNVKPKQRPDRYNEMRSFLEQKQQVLFMPVHLPSNGNEDILE